jgi:hypothetical protein
MGATHGYKILPVPNPVGSGYLIPVPKLSSLGTTRNIRFDIVEYNHEYILTASLEHKFSC